MCDGGVLDETELIANNCWHLFDCWVVLQRREEIQQNWPPSCSLPLDLLKHCNFGDTLWQSFHQSICKPWAVQCWPDQTNPREEIRRRCCLKLMAEECWIRAKQEQRCLRILQGHRMVLRADDNSGQSVDLLQRDDVYLSDFAPNRLQR